MTSEEIRDIASQLSHPRGETGLRVAAVMHETNIGMTRSAIDAVDLHNGERFLEIGHGNCGHFEELMQKVPDLRYFGLEISELMHDCGIKIQDQISNGKLAKFILYNGRHIPLDNCSIDKAITVNTIYFWKDPPAFLNEIYRVLIKGGLLSIAFGQLSYMKQLPFTQYGFELYDTAKIETLIAGSLFQKVAIQNRSEWVESKIGGKVNRDYTVITLQKQVL